MAFTPVIFWTDALVYLLVLVIAIFAWQVRRSEHFLVPWRRVGHSASGMAAATVLLFFVVIGLLDTIHMRPTINNGGVGEKARSVEVLSLLDIIARPLKTRVEKTYSAPFAAYLYAKETMELPDGSEAREFPRLKFWGGTPAVDPEAAVIRRRGFARAAGCRPRLSPLVYVSLP